MFRKKIVGVALSLGALLCSCGTSAVDAGVYLTPEEMSSVNDWMVRYEGRLTFSPITFEQYEAREGENTLLSASGERAYLLKLTLRDLENGTSSQGTFHDLAYGEMTGCYSGSLVSEMLFETEEPRPVSLHFRQESGKANILLRDEYYGEYLFVFVRM